MDMRNLSGGMKTILLVLLGLIGVTVLLRLRGLDLGDDNSGALEGTLFLLGLGVLSYNYYINQKVATPEIGSVFMTTILTTVLANLVVWIAILWVKSADVLQLLSKVSMTLVVILVMMFIGFYVMTFQKTEDKY